MPLRLSASSALCLACGALLLASCRDREVQAYQVPKEPAIPPELAASVAPSAPTAPTPSRLRWTPPADWSEKPPGAMRRGSYAVGDTSGPVADFSIIAFPGDAGGLLENVNRWRGQVGLAPLSPTELENALQHLDAGPLHLDVVEFVGTADGQPTGLVGAVLVFGGESWFFKLMGPDAVVAAAKPGFMSLLRSLEVSP